VAATDFDTDLYPDLAETLVAAAGEALADDDVALAMLEKMVRQTIDQGLSLGSNESAIITTTALAAQDTDPTYTGGAGFGIGRFQISLSLAASSDTFTIARNDDDDLKLPQGAAASIMLAWREKKLPKS
jgi:hypothetical protein